MKANTEVQELKKQLQEIQQKLEEIEKKNVKEVEDSCLIKGLSVNHQGSFYFLEDYDSEFGSVESGGNPDHSMHFADEEQCKRYAEALTTFILLRKQPGSEVAGDVVQFVIDTDSDGSVIIRSYNGYWFKIGNISPCFNSEESARKAIEILGEERILNMFKYFHS